MGKFLAGIIVVGIVLSLHAIFTSSLTSLFIAPLILATWITFSFASPQWPLFFLILIAELTSQTPPGAMAAALFIPLAIKPFTRAAPVGFTARFFTLISAITTAQVTILSAATAYHIGISAIAWPAGLYAIIGSTLAVFLICITWYELTTR